MISNFPSEAIFHPDDIPSIGINHPDDIFSIVMNHPDHAFSIVMFHLICYVSSDLINVAMPLH